MTELFLSLVNRSLAAGWLVLALVLLRPLLKKAPRWICVALWGLVALRLLSPFTLESALSLIPSAQVISPEIMTDPVPAIHTGIAAVNSTVNPVLQESFAPQPEASANPLQIFLPLCALVWAVGVAAMAVYALVSWLRLRNRVNTAVRLRENIYQSDWALSPFVLGLMKPRIYLPFGTPEGDMEHILAHERAHIRRKDHWWKPIGFALLALHWFHPLMWMAYVLLCRDIELACDEKVIRQMDTQQRADYSQTMLRCGADRRFITACPLAFGEVGVKARIKHVLSYKRPAFWIILAALILCIAVAVCFLTDPADASKGSDAVHTPQNPYIAADLTPQSCYVGGELIMMHGGLSYVPEDGSNYEDIQFSEAGLSLYIHYDGKRSFPYVQTEALSREELVQRLQENFFVSFPLDGHTAMPVMDSVVPQCDNVTIYMYRENGTDEHPAYSVYFFDGEPKWFAERVNTRIYDLQPLPYSPSRMTLEDVKNLARVEEQITWEHIPDCVSVVYGSGIVRADFPIDAAYKLQFYVEGGGRLSGNGELICIPTGDRVDIRTGDLDAFLEKNRIQAREAVISDAIMARHASEEADGEIHVEGHVFLAQYTYTEIDTVYMLVLHRVYSVVNGQLQEKSESLVPTVLTFSVDSAGQYRLTDYWEPQDGSGYEEDVKQKYPAFLAAMNDRWYLSKLQEQCEKKAQTALAAGEW